MKENQEINPILWSHYLGLTFLVWNVSWKNLISLTAQSYESMGYPDLGFTMTLIIIFCYALANFFLGNIDQCIKNPRHGLIIGNIGYLFFIFGCMITSLCDYSDVMTICDKRPIYTLNILFSMITGVWGVIFQRSQYLFVLQITNKENRTQCFCIFSGWQTGSQLFASILAFFVMSSFKSHSVLFGLYISVNLFVFVLLKFLPNVGDHQMSNKANKSESFKEIIEATKTGLKSDNKLRCLTLYFLASGMVSTYSSSLVYQLIRPTLPKGLTPIETETRTIVGLILFGLSSALFSLFFSGYFKRVSLVQFGYRAEVAYTAVVVTISILLFSFKFYWLAMVVCFMFGIVVNLSGTVSNSIISSEYPGERVPYILSRSVYSFGGVLLLIFKIVNAHSFFPTALIVLTISFISLYYNLNFTLNGCEEEKPPEGSSVLLEEETITDRTLFDLSSDSKATEKYSE